MTRSWHSVRRWGRPQAVCGWRWAPAAPCPARRAVACQGRWGPWRSLLQGKADPRRQARGRDLPGWTGPDRAWDCWRSTPDCWLSRDPGRGRCSWHWGPRRSGGAGGSYLEVRTGRRSPPAGRSRGAWAPPALGEGTWAVLTAGGQTEAPGCYAAWREGNLCPEAGPTEGRRLIQDQRPEGSAESLVRWWRGTSVQIVIGCWTQLGTVTGRARARCEPAGGVEVRRGGRKENGPGSPGRPERCRSPTPLNSPLPRCQWASHRWSRINPAGWTASPVDSDSSPRGLVSQES